MMGRHLAHNGQSCSVLDGRRSKSAVKCARCSQCRLPEQLWDNSRCKFRFSQIPPCREQLQESCLCVAPSATARPKTDPRTPPPSVRTPRAGWRSRQLTRSNLYSLGGGRVSCLPQPKVTPFKDWIRLGANSTVNHPEWGRQIRGRISKLESPKIWPEPVDSQGPVLEENSMPSATCTMAQPTGLSPADCETCDSAPQVPAALMFDQSELWEVNPAVKCCPPSDAGSILPAVNGTSLCAKFAYPRSKFDRRHMPKLVDFTPYLIQLVPPLADPTQVGRSRPNFRQEPLEVISFDQAFAALGRCCPKSGVELGRNGPSLVGRGVEVTSNNQQERSH